MKKEEIVITDKTIVLGIFATKNFEYFAEMRKCIYYDRFSLFLKENNKYLEYSILMEIIASTCEIADKIIFILDDVHFPIDTSSSITCKELELVCKNDEFFNKTIFVKGDNVINFDKNIL